MQKSLDKFFFRKFFIAFAFENAKILSDHIVSIMLKSNTFLSPQHNYCTKLNIIVDICMNALM